MSIQCRGLFALPDQMDVPAFAIVILTAVYFLALAGVALASPALATRFLFGHAGTATAHYLELLIRFVVGAGFLLHGPNMRFPQVFVAFAWIILITTAILVVVPWRWHQRFAQRSVARAIRYLRAIAFASMLFGALILTAALSTAI